jgi:glyoxylase-like metal-dependent hydrolase (beta-lactamase superfamily II)
MNIMNTGIRTPWEHPPEEGETIEVAKGVHWIRLPLPMKLDHVNVYALDDGDGWTIIDTGMNSKRTKTIWQKLLDGPLSGKPVHRVIMTHHHPDHIGLVGWFMQEHRAKLWASRTSYLMGRMLTLDVQALPPQETIDFWRRSGMDETIIKERAEGKPFNFADMVSPIPLGYKRLQESEVISMGGRDWVVRMGNGHAPEHATFWSVNNDIVIAGDQIISSISPNLGVYVTEPEADPVGEWLLSCEGFLPHARLEHLVLSGHKLPFTGLAFRLTQLIENHHSALGRLRIFLNRPRTASECFQPLFKRTIAEGEYGLALVEAVAHLNHLFGTGEVSRVLNNQGAYVYQYLD